MPEPSFQVLPTLVIGQTDTVVSRNGSRKKTVAGILGQETDPATGLRTIWLDRIVHRAGESRFESGGRSWSVSGAISTILREEPAPSKAP